jgi:hypothetical protein
MVRQQRRVQHRLERGHAGRSPETQPISFDVIQELQLVVSPYDVRQGMFSGGGINAITRSGTNQMRGSTFYVFRTRAWSATASTTADRHVRRQAVRRNARRADPPNKAFFPGQRRMGRKNTPSAFRSGTVRRRFGILPRRSRFATSR